MKIIVAGPIPSQKVSGGVAVFDKNIALTLANLDKNNKILVATKNPKAINAKDKYPSNVEFTSIFNFIKISRFKADVIISDLWYSLFFCTRNVKAVKIHTIHAFPDFVSYKIWKFNIMHLVDKYLRKHYDYLIANSSFTKYLYEYLYNISIDGLYTIGLDPNMIKFLKEHKSYKNVKDILYVGRIVKVKHLDTALEAVSQLNPNDYRLFKIWGYGDKEPYLKKKYSNNAQIVFKGAMNHFDVYKAYQSSKVFISLNPAEPFGITYEEAIANGLYVVAPNTGGGVDFLKQYPERCSLVDISNERDIILGLEKGLSSNLSPLTDEELDKLSYSNTINEILTVIEK